MSNNISLAGLDFGNLNCVIASVGKSGVEVALNPSSNRLTPTMVTFSENRRYSGEEASQQQIQYSSGTITDLRRLVMLPFNSHEREEIASHSPFELVELDDGMTGIKVFFNQKDQIFRPEQCIAFLFKDLATFSGQNDFVITVAPYWTEKHRRALINACKIANINCVSLLTSSTAAAIAYTIQHRLRLPQPNQRPVSVAFVDIGGSAMNLAIANIKQQSVEMVVTTHTEKINGSKFTELFEKYLLNKVIHKYHIDPSGKPRAMLRFRQAVEKAKKNLSINPVVQFEVSSFMNVDISFMVKREEFTDQIKDLLQFLQEPINEAFKISNIKKESIFELQLLGGTTRVTAVKEELTRLFGKKPMKSMNLDECFAIGSAYMAAYLSPRINVPIVVKDISPYSLTARWTENNYNKKLELFKRCHFIPGSKLFEIKVTKEATIILSNENEDLGKVYIRTGVDHEVKVTLRIRLTQSCTISICEATFEKNGKTAEAEVSSLFYDDIPEEKINEYKSFEKDMTQIENNEKKIDDARNELESEIFSIDNDLKRNLLDFADPDTSQKIQDTLSQVKLWFEANEFDRCDCIEYQERAKILKELVKPIQQRMNHYEILLFDLTSLKDKSKEILKRAESNIKHQNDPRYDQLIKDIIHFMSDINNIKETAKHEDMDINLNEKQTELNSLEKRVQELSNS